MATSDEIYNAVRRIIVDTDHSCSHEMDSLLALAVERELLAAASRAPAAEGRVDVKALASALYSDGMQQVLVARTFTLPDMQRAYDWACGVVRAIAQPAPCPDCSRVVGHDDLCKLATPPPAERAVEPDCNCGAQRMNAIRTDGGRTPHAAGCSAAAERAQPAAQPTDTLRATHWICLHGTARNYVPIGENCPDCNRSAQPAAQGARDARIKAKEIVETYTTEQELADMIAAALADRQAEPCERCHRGVVELLPDGARIRCEGCTAVEILRTDTGVTPDEWVELRDRFKLHIARLTDGAAGKGE